MEVGVRLIGVVLRILNLLLSPLFWLKGRHRRRVPPPPAAILLKSAVELAANIRDGEITSENLVSIYIDRVKEVNPYLNAVVDERYRAAVEDAKEVDRQISEARKNGKLNELVKTKPLLGVPFSVKESCSLAGLSNSMGCLENAGRRATADGEVVRLVRAAGAIPLLVSNTPELCLGWETTNLLRGATNNPYCLNRTPGGSSGGEGALLACGASAFSVASDVAGSIRVPAAFCGVFGHKPTPGIISIEGHIPMLNDELFPRFLAVGPMARRAEDLPLLMDIMAGDKKDKFKLDQPVDLRKLKVHYMTEAGISLALIRVHRSISDMIINAAKYLERECGSTISNEKFKDLEDSVEISVSVFFSMKDIPNMLQDPANPKRDKSLFGELLKSIFGSGTRSLQVLGFTMINKSHLFIPKSRRGYYRTKAKELREQMIKTLGDNGVLLYPVCNGLAHYHSQVFLRASGVMYTMVFNILGMPATTVPMGLYQGLPIGIQVVAAPNQDRLCLAVAKQLEKGFGGWRPPQ
ncbi:fatty-acid amide hydrolase 2-B-like [Pectinophora gossypiella]|uniref:fatty-acid amide hydrolase 2-B-like n=1 Tax=Pectinophora gossypiella TaxID=13191 RepID=UPI00214F16D4|nr:fatty-acid amide hydrolase 2-B-like [Pectinophora gossypiella]XP_049869843.1 fatty-acid amide hydrolase 2-B-like [Pectinophora gossypiella]